jgi:putative endonuclease
MAIVYILQNSLSGRHYIGSTNDLNRRLAEHNRGQTKSTRQKGRWELKYKEEFSSPLEAKRREKQIKSYKGGNSFKSLFAGVVQQ